MLIQSSQLLTASQTVDNLLTGSQYEFLPWDASLSFAVNGDTNGADLRFDVYSGQDVLCENATCNAQNRIPVNPDDYNLRDYAAAGERIKIRVRNTNAAASRTVFFAVIIEPV